MNWSFVDRLINSRILDDSRWYHSRPHRFLIRHRLGLRDHGLRRWIEVTRNSARYNRRAP